MYLQEMRLDDNGHSTIGTMHTNGEFECFTLEDTHNEPKIYGKTRIPSGEYTIQLRTTGGMNTAYAKKYGDKHHGMLWLQDVPDFEWVYLHSGNTDEDTDGCILVGNSCDSKAGTIGDSRNAYEKLYDKVSKAILDGEEVTIHII